MKNIEELENWYYKIKDILNNEPLYFNAKILFLNKISNYDSLTNEEQLRIWDWFSKYIVDINWKRIHAYIFCLELMRLTDDRSEILETHIDSFYSNISEKWGLGERIRFNGEPEDKNELELFIASEMWKNH